MTGWRKRQVLELAREAGAVFPADGSYHQFERHEDLERFAELVRADEREQIAQMIEDALALVEFAQNDKGGCAICGFTPKLAAESIRARGQA
jgi:uncharacterized protein (UPF0216 family)